MGLIKEFHMIRGPVDRTAALTQESEKPRGRLVLGADISRRVHIRSPVSVGAPPF